MKKLPVFVYGTLLNGFGNYNRYLKGKTISEHEAEILGELYSVNSGGSFPCLVDGDFTIKGQLMFVYDELYFEVMRQMDRLEGYSERVEELSMYLRREVEVYDVTTKQHVKAWVYIWNRKDVGPKIESGCFRTFKQERGKTELEWI